MQVRIQSVHFDATEKLQQFIEKKVTKLERIYDDLSTAEVILSVVKPETAENKEAKKAEAKFNSRYGGRVAAAREAGKQAAKENKNKT